MTLTLTFSIKGTKMTTAQKYTRSWMQSVFWSNAILPRRIVNPLKQNFWSWSWWILRVFCRNYRNKNKYITKPFELEKSFSRLSFPIINKVSNVLPEKWLRLSNLKIWTRLFRKSGPTSFAKYAKIVQDLERLVGIAVWSYIKYVSSATERMRLVHVVN